MNNKMKRYVVVGNNLEPLACYSYDTLEEAEAKAEEFNQSDIEEFGEVDYYYVSDLRKVEEERSIDSVVTEEEVHLVESVILYSEWVTKYREWCCGEWDAVVSCNKGAFSIEFIGHEDCDLYDLSLNEAVAVLLKENLKPTRLVQLDIM